MKEEWGEKFREFGTVTILNKINMGALQLLSCNLKTKPKAKHIVE